MTSSLPSEVEEHISAYAHFLFTRQGPWDYVSLEAEVSKYFDQWGHEPAKIDELFNRFASIWGNYYQLHDFANADAFWDLPIEFAHKWEKAQNRRLHRYSVLL